MGRRPRFHSLWSCACCGTPVPFYCSCKGFGARAASWSVFSRPYARGVGLFDPVRRVAVPEWAILRSGLPCSVLREDGLQRSSGLEASLLLSGACAVLFLNLLRRGVAVRGPGRAGDPIRVRSRCLSRVDRRVAPELWRRCFKAPGGWAARIARAGKKGRPADGTPGVGLDPPSCW